jgi:hypothetical protein
MMEHETELKAALRQLPVPEPNPDLLGRILRSRARGERISFPERDVHLPWRWIAGAAAALLAGWLLWPSQQTEHPIVTRDPVAELLRGTMLWPSSGAAQESRREIPRPKYALVSSDTLNPSRLREGVWTYQSETTTDDVLTEPSGGVRIRLKRATYASRPAWMVNTAKQFRAGGWSEYADTAYLDAASLRPHHAVAYAHKGRMRFVQTFAGDSGRESIDMAGPIQKSWRGAVGFPFPRSALFMNDWSTYRLTALLPAFPLSRGWRGTLYQVAFISQAGARSVAPLDLRVVGTERVTVPAGTFDCWRLEIETHLWETERGILWVARDQGWLIKKEFRGSDYVIKTTLQSYEPGS